MDASSCSPNGIAPPLDHVAWEATGCVLWTGLEVCVNRFGFWRTLRRAVLRNKQRTL